METFRSYRIRQNEDRSISAGFEDLTLDDLTEGEVVIQTSYSTINYKDALASTGKGRILRKYPLNGGIDLAGKVSASTDSRYKEGDSVLVCGCGLSEIHDGGYSEYARVPGDCVVPMPAGLTEYEAMAFGTAGFTAAIAVIRMEDNGQIPERGPIVVTGATGGVGSFAISMFANLGYEVIALSGKKEHEGYLRALGATNMIDRHTLELGDKPLEATKWGGAVDNVGGDILGWLTRTVKPWGNIGSIGLAGGIGLKTTVMPFILRGVSLLGINSLEMPIEVRDKAWERLCSDLKPNDMDLIVKKVIDFDELPSSFDQYMEASIVGRIVVKIS
jgi:acrylyl-CoA reductase (NADPH)